MDCPNVSKQSQKASIKVPRKRKQLTESQILLAEHLRELGFACIQHEVLFCDERKWRADIYALYGSAAFNRGLFLFEADGGKWHGGHRRGNALEADYEKQNWAVLHGYKLLRFTNQQILSGWAKAWLKENL